MKESHREYPSLSHIYNTLSSWPENHTPSSALDKTMEQLLSCVTDPHTTHDLSENEIINLRKINASVEYQAEKHIAVSMLSLPNPFQVLDNFVYNDYQKLIASEKTIIETNVPHAHEKPWLFIGGGPLPLSAILLAKEYGIKSRVIDASEEATEISSKLISKLEKENNINKGSITIAQGEAESTTDYRNHHVIFVAALAGETKEAKQTIFRQIKQHAPENAHILARSSHGKRQLLYLPVPESAYTQFDLLYEAHPHNDVLNSTLLFKQRSK